MCIRDSVALDADVKNSTFSERFEMKHPERFYQCFIAEQVMIGAAMGLASRGAIPFPSTFAAFLSRAADFIRMAAISGLNIKMAGSHAGVSIGEDGASQMALEDLAMMSAEPNMTVLYPSDAVCAEGLVAAAAYHEGPVYIRTSRPKTPVIYANDTVFTVGGSRVLRESAADVATVIGAGINLFGGPLGLIQRHVVGALPIRRNTKDPAYHITLKAYVAELLHSQDFFFYPEGGHHNTLRLNFSNSTLEQIHQGMTILRELFNEALHY